MTCVMDTFPVDDGISEGTLTQWKKPHHFRKSATTNPRRRVRDSPAGLAQGGATGPSSRYHTREKHQSQKLIWNICGKYKGTCWSSMAALSSGLLGALYRVALRRSRWTVASRHSLRGPSASGTALSRCPREASRRPSSSSREASSWCSSQRVSSSRLAEGGRFLWSNQGFPLVESGSGLRPVEKQSEVCFFFFSGS